MADSSIQIPLLEYVREAAREAAWTVIKEHVVSCPLKAIEKRVQVLEMRFNILLGAIVGSGALGGAIGAGVLKLLGG